MPSRLDLGRESVKPPPIADPPGRRATRSAGLSPARPYADQASAAETGSNVAQKTVISLTDDIDGSEANETVVFGLDGATYEIDLNDVHAADLREVLAPFISVAREIGAKRTGKRPTSALTGASGQVDTKAVRAWADANGVEVSSRGRIKADVLEQYKAATG